MELVQPIRNGFAVPSERKLERVVNFLILLGFGVGEIVILVRFRLKLGEGERGFLLHVGARRVELLGEQLERARALALLDGDGFRLGLLRLGVLLGALGALGADNHAFGEELTIDICEFLTLDAPKPLGALLGRTAGFETHRLERRFDGDGVERRGEIV